jgi:hypothetical protein
MLMLGDILALARKSAADLDRLGLPEVLVARAHEAAAREGQSPQSFVRAAVGDFSHNAHPDEWTQLMTRLRECDDPGAVCLETMLERRLAHLGAAPETADEHRTTG